MSKIEELKRTAMKKHTAVLGVIGLLGTAAMWGFAKVVVAPMRERRNHEIAREDAETLIFLQQLEQSKKNVE